MDFELRKWDLKYAVDFARYANNEKIARNVRDAFPHPYTLQDAEKYITLCMNQDENNIISYAIVIDQKAVGSIGVFRQSDVNRRCAEIGYWLAEEYWGNSIMTKAVNKICKYVFLKTDIIRIQALVFDYNSSSARVLEKCGFECEGTMKKSICKYDGIYDSKMYALLK